MWILYAFCAALFGGLTAIFAKLGVAKTDSNLVTALRMIIIVLFAWLIVLISPTSSQLGQIDMKSLIFLVLSGLTTGASWLFYFKALQEGKVNVVVPIDKSSTILTILFAIVILREPFHYITLLSLLLIAMGTWFMIEKQQSAPAKQLVGSAVEVEELNTKQLFWKHNRWLLYAVFSAIFAALTAILSKVGINNIDSNVGTAIRTIVVLVMAWVIVFMTKKQSEISLIDRKSWLFIALSGLTTGLSWLFFFRALQLGHASVVVPIDKLSLLVSVFFAVVVLKEKLSKRATIGLLLLTSGTLLLLY